MVVAAVPAARALVGQVEQAVPRGPLARRYLQRPVQPFPSEEVQALLGMVGVPGQQVVDPVGVQVLANELRPPANPAAGDELGTDPGLVIEEWLRVPQGVATVVIAVAEATIDNR